MMYVHTYIETHTFENYIYINMHACTQSSGSDFRSHHKKEDINFREFEGLL